MLRIGGTIGFAAATVSIGMMIVQAVVNPFEAQALAGYAATMRSRKCFATDLRIHQQCSFAVCNLGILAQRKLSVSKGVSCCTGVLDMPLQFFAFVVI